MAKSDLPVHPNQAIQPATTPAGLRVRMDCLYTNGKGQEKKGIRKYADKELAQLQEPLQRLLEPDEAVFYVARAQAPMGPLEQFAGGWSIYYQTRTALVVTNKRLLHFLIKGNGAWKRSLKALRWGDLVEAKVKGVLGNNLILQYRNGTKETYWRVRRADRGKLKMLLPLLQAASTGEVGEGGMVPLCPACYARLTPRVYHCEKCGLTFKDESTLTRRALLIPGGGYLYTQQWGFAVLVALGEGLLTLTLVFSLLAVLGLGGASAQEREAAMGAVTSVATVLGLEKVFHIYHCLRVVRDFMPIERKEEVLVAAAGSGEIR